VTDLALRPSTIEYTPHCLERMEEMSVSAEEVEAVLEHPDLDRPSKEHPDRQMATKGRLVVVYQPRPYRCHLAITTYWAKTDDRSEGPSTHVPVRPSNRVFLEKLALWGCTPGRRRGDLLRMRAPDGTLFEVRPPMFSQGNSAYMIRDAYAALGVTAEQFWSRETKVRPRREPVRVERTPLRSAGKKTPASPVVVRYLKAGAPLAPAPEPDPVDRLLAFRDGEPEPAAKARPQPNRGSRHSQVLDWFKLRPASAYDAAAIAEDVEFDIQFVRLACAKLCRDGLLQRVTRGHYRLAVIDENDTDRRLAEINAELATTDDMLRRADLIQERIELLHLHQPEVVDDIIDDLDEAYETYDETYDETHDDPASTGTGLASTVPVEAEPTHPVLVDYEDEIDSLLALIAPEGLQGEHQVAVARWREATRNLFDHLHA
jgi:hypothetical protein